MSNKQSKSIEDVGSDKFIIYRNDALKQLKLLPSNSFDALLLPQIVSFVSVLALFL